MQIRTERQGYESPSRAAGLSPSGDTPSMDQEAIQAFRAGIIGREALAADIIRWISSPGTAPGAYTFDRKRALDDIPLRKSDLQLDGATYISSRSGLKDVEHPYRISPRGPVLIPPFHALIIRHQAQEAGRPFSEQLFADFILPQLEARLEKAMQRYGLPLIGIRAATVSVKGDMHPITGYFGEEGHPQLELRRKVLGPRSIREVGVKYQPHAEQHIHLFGDPFTTRNPYAQQAISNAMARALIDGPREVRAELEPMNPTLAKAVFPAVIVHDVSRLLPGIQYGAYLAPGTKTWAETVDHVYVLPYVNP